MRVGREIEARVRSIRRQKASLGEYGCHVAPGDAAAVGDGVVVADTKKFASAGCVAQAAGFDNRKSEATLHQECFSVQLVKQRPASSHLIKERVWRSCAHTGYQENVLYASRSCRENKRAWDLDTCEPRNST